MKQEVSASKNRYGEDMQEVFHRRFSTELGVIELSASSAALVGLEFRETGTPACDRGSGTVSHSPALALLDCAETQVRAYLSGRLRDFDLPLDLSAGTDFQQEVWQGLMTIGYGQTLSYRELAEAIGHPHAARAVGGANHANPIPLIVPCHRVIAADGSLGGYGGGLWRKRWLLRREGAHYRQPLDRMLRA